MPAPVNPDSAVTEGPWPTSGETFIFVIGFVTHGGTGGYDWYWRLDDADRARAAIMRDGGSDLTDVRRLTLDQLALDGNYTPEAITDGLNSAPELWEPRIGEGRTITVTYDEVATTALDRIEELGENPEYERGMVNLMADLFAIPEMDTGTRMELIEADLRRRADEQTRSAVVDRVTAQAAALRDSLPDDVLRMTLDALRIRAMDFADRAGHLDAGSDDAADVLRELLGNTDAEFLFNPEVSVRFRIEWPTDRNEDRRIYAEVV